MTHQLPKFKPGDKVVYTNEYGRCWGVKTIKEIEWDIRRRVFVYTYENMDAPWSPVDEARFQPPDAEDLTYPECIHPASTWYEEAWPYFQKKYGYDASKEQSDALLDNDPFEGET